MDFTYQTATIDSGLSLVYIDSVPDKTAKGVIVLIHGFPQTAYQFRRVIKPITAAGYRVLVPDYRGVGGSSRPASENGSAFTKTIMAADIVKLLDYLGIRVPVHIVGHDIGGMIAYALASRHPDRVKSLNWGECPLPGTAVYYRDRIDNAVQQFHFIFHCVPGLPEQLVSGERQVRIYLEHFFDKISFNRDAFTTEDVDQYVREYCRDDAMRCGFEVYRAFLIDAKENEQWWKDNDKCKVPTLGLSGKESRHAAQAEEMLAGVHAKGTYEFAVVEGAGHYVAEENPEAFTKVVVDFAN